MSRPSKSHELLEDVEWMATHGESLDGAAQRLNRSPAALERALQRLGRNDLVSRLRARNPRNPTHTEHHHRRDHAA